MKSRGDKKRDHEDYWGMRWAIPFGRHINAEVRWSRPEEDPPDADFHIRKRDGSETTTWGEVTGAYHDSDEAKLLWAAGPGKGEVYEEPDKVAGIRARELVEKKRRNKQYQELARRRGLGHLLVLLHSPLTTRSARVEAERCIRELLEGAPSLGSRPFETVWLGYHLPITSPDEREDPQYVFRASGGRLNFMRCIWSSPDRDLGRIEARSQHQR